MNASGRAECFTDAAHNYTFYMFYTDKTKAKSKAKIASATGKMPVVPVAGGTPATPKTGDVNVGQHRSRSGYAGHKG